MNVYDEIIAATNSVANSTLKPRMRVVSAAAPPVRQNYWYFGLGCIFVSVHQMAPPQTDDANI